MTKVNTTEWLFNMNTNDNSIEMEDKAFSGAILKKQRLASTSSRSSSILVPASPNAYYIKPSSAKSTSMSTREIKDAIASKNSMYTGSETKSEIAADAALPATHEPAGLSCIDNIIVFLAVIIIILTFPFSICCCIKVVREHERMILFRMGKVVKNQALGPGIVIALPCVDRAVMVDLRTVLFDVPPQEILTKDSVSIAVDAVAYFKIFDAKLSVIGIGDAYRATRMMAATTLRNILGTKTLEEILSDRDEISNIMQIILDEATDPWGVHVERVELKDVRLPVQLQRAMAAEAEAAREAAAKIIAAQGEMDASEALKLAADNLESAPSSLQLRYLQTLNNISVDNNQTIVFPLPLGLIKSLTGKVK